MIENHRKFAACVLCGSTEPLTAEHLFGKSLARRIGERRPWSATLVTEDGTLETVVGGNPLLFQTYKCLCSTCNTDRLSAMMSSATPILVALARGEHSCITADEKSVLLRYLERLAFLVDVVTSNHDVSEEARETPEHRRSAEFRQSPPTFSSNIRRQWILHGHEGLPVPAVFIGRHVGVLGLELECSVDHGRIFGDGQVVPGRRFHLAIGQLAIEIQWPEEFAAVRPPGACYQRLTRTAEQVDWPASADVGYLDFFLTHVPTAGVQQKIAAYSDPAWLAKHEANVRSSTQQTF